MFSGGEKSRVTLELPKGRFETWVDGGVADVHEDPALGNNLVQDNVWQNVTTSFVVLPYYLKRTNNAGETQYGFGVDAEKCAEVFGREAEKLLGTASPAETKSLVGAARFCLDAAEIPAVRKITEQNRLDATDQLGDIMAKAHTQVEENIFLLENGDRRYYSQHLAYTLSGLLGKSSHVFTFERGAQLALGFAKAAGETVEDDVRAMLSGDRPQVYARHIQKVDEAGKRALSEGDLAAVESHMEELKSIGDEMVHFMRDMIPAVSLLNDTMARYIRQMQQLANRPTILSSL